MPDLYRQEISRATPGCLVFLLDRSDSMKEQWGQTGMTLADGASAAINNLLWELSLMCTDRDGSHKHYFDIAVIGYGIRSDGQFGVESAFGGALSGRYLVSSTDVAENPLGIREFQTPDGPVRKPVWVEPMHGYATPMCAAFDMAGSLVFDWVQQHPTSFPPVVFNITDGVVTDSPYSQPPILAGDLVHQLKTLSTANGSTLLFNVFLSPYATVDRVFLPNTPQGLPVPGPEMFEWSSVLPAPMIEAAAGRLGITVAPGARGLAFNAAPEQLTNLLDIGSKPNKVGA